MVGALGGTILYTINPRRRATDAYELKVLTVVSQWPGGDMPEAMRCETVRGDLRKTGAAGHVAVTYPSGGQLVTSMGHWIELTRIDTSLESIMQAWVGPKMPAVCFKRIPEFWFSKRTPDFREQAERGTPEPSCLDCLPVRGVRLLRTTLAPRKCPSTGSL